MDIKPIVLTNRTICLRPYTPADAQDLYQAARESIRELTPWMPWTHADATIGEIREWLAANAREWANGTDYEFAIVDAQTGAYLGGCGLNNFRSAKKIANLCYWVRTSRTRQGIATAAARLLAEWRLKELKLNRIEIVVAVRNLASQRVATKAGTTREGIMRNGASESNEITDAVMFSLIPQDLIHR